MQPVCLTFKSTIDLHQFIQSTFPNVLEWEGCMIFGHFTEAEIEIAVSDFQAFAS